MAGLIVVMMAVGLLLPHLDEGRLASLLYEICLLYTSDAADE